VTPPAAPPPRRGGLPDWLDHRTGYRAILRRFLFEEIPGGASAAYVFGSATLFVLILQAVTGVLLTFTYAPSAATAHASLAYLESEVLLGRVLRSAHYWGASVMVILVTAHLLQTLIWGAYRKPREMNWIFGVMLLLVTLGFAFTGFLLPWNQEAYWGTAVGIGIAESVPLIGPGLAAILRGGPGIGTLTLTRFFALHVLVLPAVTILLVAAHVTLFRRHRVTPHWRVSEALRQARSETFYPRQMLLDALAMLAVFAVVVVLALAAPPDLGAPADPSVSTVVPAPDWYFYPLYTLLQWFDGPFAVVGSVILPGLLFALMVVLPFLDRSPSPAPGRRSGWVFGGLAITTFTVALGVVGHNTIESRRAELAAALPPLEVADAFARGEVVYSQTCVFCHAADGRGEPPVIPPLAGSEWVTGETVADRETLARIILFGIAGEIVVQGEVFDQMMMLGHEQVLADSEIADVATYVRNAWGHRASPLDPDLVARLRELGPPEEYPRGGRPFQGF
jgi:ubiquinol-cytochrome c reductase cytochrome b subunit